MTIQPDWPPRASAIGLPDGYFQRGSTGQMFKVKGGQWCRVNEGECTCGAATEGKWADIHTKGCPALGLGKSDQRLIDDAWEKHKAAAPRPAHAPTDDKRS